MRPPWRAIAPTFECSRCPFGRFVGVTKVAGVRNLQFFGLCRPNEAEGVTANVNVSDRLRDLRHMARNAFAAGAISRVVRMLLDASGVRPILRVGAVARQAKSVTSLAHNSRIVSTVRIVAAKAGNATGIHEAGDEIIPLHPVLVGRPLGEMGEGCFSELVLL